MIFVKVIISIEFLATYLGVICVTLRSLHVDS